MTRTLDRAFPESRRVLAALLIVMAAGYVLFSDLTGGTLLAHQGWDSYTLQTYNWLQGRTYLADGEHYSWLELAIYQGKYYVSFPPLPSVVLIPFVLIWQTNTPNNVLIALYGLIAAALAYRIMLVRGRSPRAAAFWALVCVWGSNMLWMTTIAGVWFQAQALNMVMCLAAVLSALRGRRAWATTFLALAVGCRPLSAVFLPVFAMLFALEDQRLSGDNFILCCLRQWRCLIGPILIGTCYMAYNYVRFDNPLEFGHNYLPEFVRAENGQFHIRYLWPNLKRLLFEPIRFQFGLLDIPRYNGFMFFLANPIFLIWFIRCVLNLWRDQWFSPMGILVAVGLAVELLLTCMHRTLGGWQFGARYTCDMIPFAYMYLAHKGPRQRPSPWELTLGGIAVAFNAYGVMYMYLTG